jgi:CO/xanthine dehydrogenase Mo-binding subunit
MPLHWQKAAASFHSAPARSAPTRRVSIQSTAPVAPGRPTCSAARFEGQIEGGIVQALGQGLMEDYKLENGHTTTSGFAKYILPTSLDVPQVNSIILEDPDPIGPLGVKGIGEPAMVPTIPAIMNAIYDAVGVRITALPATPEKVLEAIREKNRAAQRVAAE